VSESQKKSEKYEKPKESPEEVKKRLLKSIDALDFEKLGALKGRSRGGSSIIIWSLTFWSR
jgi:hypothetical protein